MDAWFERYKVILSERDMLDKPHEIWNADETGFTTGSKAGKVIGPYRSNYSHDIPHVSGESFKQRLTVMYCANAEGQLMAPLFRLDENAGKERPVELLFDSVVCCCIVVLRPR